jgi:putative endonuclease
MEQRRQHIYFVSSSVVFNGTLYVGVSSDLRFRVRQHKDHTFRGFTATYDVDRLLYYETFGEIANAIKREKQMKGWRREKKIALIEKLNSQWKDLSREWYLKPEAMSF